MNSTGGLDFKALPKLELHAHLSGSISPQCLHELWALKKADPESHATVAGLPDPLSVMGGEQKFDLLTFFPLFSKYIYTLIADAPSIMHSTTSVLQHFQDDGVVYLELRTTPRAIPAAGITRAQYIALVLRCIRDFASPTMVTKLILSIDRAKMSAPEAVEVVELAHTYHDQGVVGVDLCGDPSKGSVSIFRDAFVKAKEYGLGITLHFAECAAPLRPVEGELETLLGFWPDRIGHVIYVPEGVKRVIEERKLGLELCLSCNVKLGMMPDEAGYKDHHFEFWRGTACAVTLCTDDVGVVGSPLSNEYALVKDHFQLEDKEICALARSGIESIFGGEEEKERLRDLMW